MLIFSIKVDRSLVFKDFMFFDRTRFLFLILVILIVIYLFYTKFNWQVYFFSVILNLFFYIFFLMVVRNLFTLIFVYELLVIFIILAIIINSYQFERFILIFYLFIYIILGSYGFIYYFSGLGLFNFFPIDS